MFKKKKKQTSWLNQGKKWGNIYNESAQNKRQKNFFNCTEIYTNKFENLKKKNHSLWESFPFEQTHLISKAELDSMTVEG